MRAAQMLRFLTPSILCIATTFCFPGSANAAQAEGNESAKLFLRVARDMLADQDAKASVIPSTRVSILSGIALEYERLGERDR